MDKAQGLLEGVNINVFVFYRCSYERKLKSYAQAKNKNKKTYVVELIVEQIKLTFHTSFL